MQVQDQVFGGGIQLVPLIKRLDIDRANAGRALGKELVHQMTADKAAGPANQNMRTTDRHQLHLSR